MFMLSKYPQTYFPKGKTSYIAGCFLVRALPFFLYGLWGVIVLPVATSRLLNYPLQIEDAKYNEAEDEDRFLVE